MCVTVDMFV